MSKDFSQFSQDVGTSYITEETKCPNCGYMGLKKGEFCPFCKTYLSYEGAFIKVGEKNYPVSSEQTIGIYGETLEADHKRIEYLNKLIFKKKQIRNISILGIIILVQISWLIFR